MKLGTLRRIAAIARRGMSGGAHCCSRAGAGASDAAADAQQGRHRVDDDRFRASVADDDPRPRTCSTAAWCAPRTCCRC